LRNALTASAATSAVPSVYPGEKASVIMVTVVKPPGGEHRLLRRLFHVSGIVIPLTYLFWGKGAALVLGTLIFLLLSAGEILRLTGILNPSLVTGQLKEKERKRPTGAFSYAGSCLLTMLIFREPVAVASMFVLAISDPLSSLIGSRWGRCRFFGKSLEGTSAFLFSSLVILACLRFRIPAVVGGACAGTFAELFSSRFMDDNLSIPLACSCALWILS
jgi:dolichol kinase